MTIGSASTVCARIIASGVNSRPRNPSGPERDSSRYSARPTTAGGRPSSALTSDDQRRAVPGNRQTASNVPSGRPSSAAAAVAVRLTSSDKRDDFPQFRAGEDRRQHAKTSEGPARLAHYTRRGALRKRRRLAAAAGRPPRHAKIQSRPPALPLYTRTANRRGAAFSPRPAAFNQNQGNLQLMKSLARILLSAAVALPPLVAGGSAMAQKSGGTLRIYHRDSPANMSIHEEGTISVVAPMMPVFNNLVVFNQHEKQNRLDNIVPDLAESWTWSEDGKDLTFKLHQGVKWHDGKPFTAADVKCTWDLLQGKAQGKTAPQRPRGVVGQSRRGHRRQRLSGDVSPEAAAAVVPRVPRLRVHAGLSVPRLAGADAAAPDRHRSVQIRRVQAEPVDQGHEEPGLLEEGAALSRRRSNGRSSRTARRRCSPSSPASST